MTPHASRNSGESTVDCPTLHTAVSTPPTSQSPSPPSYTVKNKDKRLRFQELVKRQLPWEQ